MTDARYRKRQRKNAVMLGLTALCAAASISLLFFIFGYIAYRGLSSVSLDFLTKLPRPVGETGGGIANAIVGSAKVVALASVLGVPVGILGGIYLAEFGGNKTAFAIRYATDVLTGVPSIIMGVFAYALIVRPMKSFSALAGGAALAVIMLPIVLRSTEEFVRLVPASIREAALALGVPQWKVILRVVLPTASRGIVTASLLAMSRIAGETAPLLFTAFGNQFWDDGWLHPIATLPMAIFTYAISPYDDWHRQAWAAALVLMLFVLGVNVVARLFLEPAPDARG